MAAHLHETAIVATILADEDCLHCSFHVVVDAAPAGALEQSERPVVGVEHHLLRLARITPHKQHPAVTEPSEVTHFEAKVGGTVEYQTTTMDIADYLTQGGLTAGHRELWRLLRTLFNGNGDSAEYTDETSPAAG